jgi:hypothetical protein
MPQVLSRASGRRKRLIFRKARLSILAILARMESRDEPETLPLCPSCANPMRHVRTIWRAFADDTDVFECRPCRLSLDQTSRRSRTGG